jgi:hypothetical protein
MTAGIASASITINEVRGDWQNVIGAGATLDEIDTDGLVGNEEIRWGIPVGTEKSGYRFDSVAPPPMPVALGDVFKLGDFTHFNFQIFDPTITSADLALTLDLTVDGSSFSQGPLTFLFNHDETPNGFGPPASNDIVALTNRVTDTTFFVGGVEYTLALVGLSSDGGNTLLDSFSTVEKETNTAGLYGMFSRANPVPEPSTFAVWSLLGLIGILLTKPWHRLRKE